ncbi:MAG: hypothetical protein B6D37_07115 [Sphingobacteriales bacterium UTBCD1]|jgi:hypothetical protein|nr:MAG: hypothetical protein B6D37_07115 [Sphingobacteriales bacterium UTBCD1]
MRVSFNQQPDAVDCGPIWFCMVTKHYEKNISLQIFRQNKIDKESKTMILFRSSLYKARPNRSFWRRYSETAGVQLLLMNTIAYYFSVSPWARWGSSGQSSEYCSKQMSKHFLTKKFQT